MDAERPTPILCCGGGTPHKPPILQPDGYVLHEGTECAQFLIAQVCAHCRSIHRLLQLRRDAQACHDEFTVLPLKVTDLAVCIGTVRFSSIVTSRPMLRGWPVARPTVLLCVAESVASEGRRTGIAAEGGVQL